MLNLILSRHLLGHSPGGNAEGGLIRHLAVFHNVRDNGLHIPDGNGEAQTLHSGIGIAGILGGHNAHHLAVQVHQRAAGVAGVDGGVHLDHVKGRAVHIDGPVAAGYDALAHGEGQFPQGIADGQHRVAYIHVAAVAQSHRL